MEDRIVVTSVGIVSALGKGVAANREALRSGRSGLGYARHLRSIHTSSYLLGEAGHSNEELAAGLQLPANDGTAYTRTTLLALTALDELLSTVPRHLLADHSFAFVNANTVGGMCAVEDLYPQFISPEQEGDFVRYISTLDCAESTENVCRHFGLKPRTATISTACSSSGNALILGARMIRHGLAERAICGGCDALSRFTVNGFLSLKNVSREACRPFDQDRNGLNLGEGAAYLLLEKEQDALARGAEILAYFSGYANGNDAYHPTAPSPDGAGALRTMQQALDKAGLQPADIGYVNAHGTATLNNDASEGKALMQLFGETPPPFSSTKAFTGHTLAAAGAIEALFSIWALQGQEAYANLHFSTRMEELTISPVTERMPIQASHVLSNSFGFGGNNVSLIFSRS